MYRFLIVEDVGLTFKQLRSLIVEEFPESLGLVDVATTVAEAADLIDRIDESFYDVVILDLRLPSRKGENPEIDESLCRKVRARSQSTLVVHITAYPEDELVQDHLRRVHTEQPSSNSLVIPKRDPLWATKLVAKLKTYLHTNRIWRLMDEVVGDSRAAVNSGARARPRLKTSPGRGDTTHHLAFLCREIESHWRYLEDGLKQRIQGTFNVETRSEGIRVSLL